MFLHHYWNLCIFREQKTILQDRFLLIWEKFLDIFENLGISLKILRFRINIMEICTIRISLLGLLLFKTTNNKNLTSAQWSQFFYCIFSKKYWLLNQKCIYCLSNTKKINIMKTSPNYQKVSDETYRERYFLFLREQLARLDKEFKSSFDKAKELRKRYLEAINDKGFVGKELTELQRAYEALEEATNHSREILRELKLKDKILNYEAETII